MLLKVPVITTRHNGVPEAIAPRFLVVLVDEKDVKHLKETIQHPHPHDGLKRENAEACSTFAREQFDFEKCCATITIPNGGFC